MTVLTKCLAPNSLVSVVGTLLLTADERTRSRYRHDLSNDLTVYLQLPRGTVLRSGDLLRSDNGDELFRIEAKPEPVLTVTASSALNLMLAVYHLANRHVPLEVTETYLRLAPDPVLKSLLIEQLQTQVTEEIAPFCPQAGAYQAHGHKHEHSHSHDSHRHDHSH
jgi:urease accessory protein